METAKRKTEAFLEDVTSYPRLVPTVPSVSFGVKEQKDVAVLVKVLLRREGLATNVRCTPRRLSITLSATPSDLGSHDVMNILSVLMAVGHHLEEVHGAEGDFVLSIDFWAKGGMETTLGRAKAFARRLKEGSVTLGEFWGAFDFWLV